MWPFSRKKKQKDFPKSNRHSVVKVSNRFVRIESLDFFGSFSLSKNGKYTVAWSDSDRESGVGGFREEGEGPFVLGENGIVILEGKLQRPHDGKVANNGNFILNDWMFGERLQGTFYAFDKTGRQLVKHHFTANFYNNGLSNDGRYAVCQLAHSNSSDGGTLAFFDIEQGQLLWQKIPESGWANSYEFDVERKELLLRYREIGAFRYNFLGEFLEKDRWEKERIKHASASELSFIAIERLKELGGNVSKEAGNEIISLLNKALKKGLNNYPNEKASVYRAIGEIQESFGNIDEAIYNYETALTLNPNVGVKRRLTTLKKQKS